MPQTGEFNLRPMGVGDILDMTFRLFRARATSLLAISLTVYVPYAAAMLLLKLAVAEPHHIVEGPFGPQEVAGMMETLVSTLTNFAFLAIVLPIVQGAVMYAISAAYLGEEISALGALGRSASRLPAVLGTQMLTGLVVLLGFLLLVVPGVIFSLWFMLIIPVVLLESRSGGGAMGRSRELMSGNLGKGFLLNLAVGALNLVLMVALGMAIRMVGITNPIVDEAARDLLQGLILPILVAPTILLYYDLRIRKEAFDLERLSSSISGQPVSS